MRSATQTRVRVRVEPWLTLGFTRYPLGLTRVRNPKQARVRVRARVQPWLTEGFTRHRASWSTRVRDATQTRVRVRVHPWLIGFTRYPWANASAQPKTDQGCGSGLGSGSPMAHPRVHSKGMVYAGAQRKANTGSGSGSPMAHPRGHSSPRVMVYAGAQPKNQGSGSGEP